MRSCGVFFFPLFCKKKSDLGYEINENRFEKGLLDENVKLETKMFDHCYSWVGYFCVGYIYFFISDDKDCILSWK